MRRGSLTTDAMSTVPSDPVRNGTRPPLDEVEVIEPQANSRASPRSARTSVAGEHEPLGSGRVTSCPTVLWRERGFRGRETAAQLKHRLARGGHQRGRLGFRGRETAAQLKPCRGRA